jgi:S-adenosylmethionine:tRNA ribosyltransferase-isomerase
MKTSDFDYKFDDSLIALEPLKERSASRMLCLDKNTGEIQHRTFKNLPELLHAGDLLVFNDTKVIPAKLTGQRSTGGKVNILIERVIDDTTAFAHVKHGKDQPFLTLSDGTQVHVTGRKIPFFILKLENGTWHDTMDRLGEMPLPPYIERPPQGQDRNRYQTVYANAKKAASVAAPTAGLHFDEPILNTLKARGINTTNVTLHVGAGTFQPLRTEDDEDPRSHHMHSERIEITQETCDLITQTRKNGGRIIAVGTTAVRCLETAQGKPYSGETDIFITPGYEFKYVDALITNFHLPKTTLLMLVSAFAGRDHTMQAYKEATEEKYRFFSYGDAMFIS